MSEVYRRQPNTGACTGARRLFRSGEGAAFAAPSIQTLRRPGTSEGAGLAGRAFFRLFGDQSVKPVAYLPAM